MAKKTYDYYESLLDTVLVLSAFFVWAYVPAGAMYNTYTPGLIEVSTISMIGGKTVNDASNEGILKIIEDNGLEDNLILGSNGNELKLTKIIANDKNYYTNIENFKNQLEKNEELVYVFEDLPAIEAGLRGVIIKVNDKKIKDHEELANIMKSFIPGDEIKITTKEK